MAPTSRSTPTMPVSSVAVECATEVQPALPGQTDGHFSYVEMMISMHPEKGPLDLSCR